MRRDARTAIMTVPPAARGAEDVMSAHYVAFAALLLLAAAGCGVVAADDRDQESPVASEQTAIAISESDLQPVETFDSSTEAAIAAAAAVHPEATDLRLSHTVVILASQQLVDLRVQVTGDDVCDWYGVSGVPSANEIAWRAGLSAIGCAPAE